MYKYLIAICILGFVSCVNNNTGKLEAQVPASQYKPTKDQQERRERSVTYCTSHNVPAIGYPLYMLWALGFVDSLDYPQGQCNVPSDVKILHDLTKDQFIQKAKLRSKKEILDQADLIFRLDWACTEARIHQTPMPAAGPNIHIEYLCN